MCAEDIDSKRLWNHFIDRLSNYFPEISTDELNITALPNATAEYAGIKKWRRRAGKAFEEQLEENAEKIWDYKELVDAATKIVSKELSPIMKITPGEERKTFHPHSTPVKNTFEQYLGKVRCCSETREAFFEALAYDLIFRREFKIKNSLECDIFFLHLAQNRMQGGWNVPITALLENIWVDAMRKEKNKLSFKSQCDDCKTVYDAHKDCADIENSHAAAFGVSFQDGTRMPVIILTVESNDDILRRLNRLRSLKEFFDSQGFLFPWTPGLYFNFDQKKNYEIKLHTL